MPSSPTRQPPTVLPQEPLQSSTVKDDAQLQHTYDSIVHTFKGQLKIIEQRIIKHAIHKELRHEDMYSDLKDILNKIDPDYSPASDSFFRRLCEGSFEIFLELDYQQTGLLFDYAEGSGQGALEIFTGELEAIGESDETLKHAVDKARSEWKKLERLWEDRSSEDRVKFWRDTIRLWPDNDRGLNNDLAGFLHWTTETHLPSVLSSMNDSSNTSIAASTPQGSGALSEFRSFSIATIPFAPSGGTSKRDSLKSLVEADIGNLFLPSLTDDTDHSSVHSPTIPTPIEGQFDNAFWAGF
jgi:hypothetical protein